MEITPGTRVRVMNAERTEELGLGTYLGEVVIADIEDRDEEVEAEDTDVTAYEASDEQLLRLFQDIMEFNTEEKTPKILLDSGKVIYGIECWWTEASDSDNKH